MTRARRPVLPAPKARRCVRIRSIFRTRAESRCSPPARTRRTPAPKPSLLRHPRRRPLHRRPYRLSHRQSRERRSRKRGYRKRTRPKRMHQRLGRPRPHPVPRANSVRRRCGLLRRRMRRAPKAHRPGRRHRRRRRPRPRRRRPKPQAVHGACSWDCSRNAKTRSDCRAMRTTRVSRPASPATPRGSIACALPAPPIVPGRNRWPSD